MPACQHSVGQSGAQGQAYRLGVRLALALYAKRTTFEARCVVCRAPNVVCCLQCGHTACVKHGKHTSGHHLGVCLWSKSEGYLYCFEDNTLIFDPKFEALRLSEAHLVLGSIDSKPALAMGQANGKSETTDIVKSAKRPSFHATTGLRGFHNMGATCYMSVILQSLIHNPLVRGFFLAGGHDSMACTRKNCVQCSVDRVYCDLFTSDDVGGYGISDLLLASAAVMPSLTGATEQDAHEFLHFLLEQFHRSHFPEKAYLRASKQANDTVGGPSPDPEECSCVAHRTFSGMIENVLECSCGFVKYTHDPLMDLSLEVTGESLLKSFAKFTEPERLSHFRCSSCGEVGNVTKRILVKKLPPVLQIQLKRFKHTGTQLQKNEEVCKFEPLLDMTPYTTNPDAKRPFIYELFGVVLHSGSLDTGHYTCMMKHASGQWFHFDDSVVTSVDVKSVLKSSAYLLFYTIKWVI